MIGLFKTKAPKLDLKAIIAAAPTKRIIKDKRGLYLCQKKFLGFWFWYTVKFTDDWGIANAWRG